MGEEEEGVREGKMRKMEGELHVWTSKKPLGHTFRYDIPEFQHPYKVVDVAVNALGHSRIL